MTDKSIAMGTQIVSLCDTRKCTETQCDKSPFVISRLRSHHNHSDSSHPPPLPSDPALSIGLFALFVVSISSSFHLMQKTSLTRPTHSSLGLKIFSQRSLSQAWGCRYPSLTPSAVSVCHQCLSAFSLSSTDHDDSKCLSS